MRKLVYLAILGALALPSLTFMETRPQVQVVEQSHSEATAREALEKWAGADTDVLAEFSRLCKALEKADDMSALDKGRIFAAVSFAAEKHKQQRRLNAKKTPYIIHPLAVAEQVISIGHVYNADVIIAALLHDTLAETETTAEEILTLFGEKVEEYVSELTGDPKLTGKERSKEQIIQAFHQTREVAIIKFSDKLQNLKTLMKDPPSGWTQERTDLYFQWAQTVVSNLPKANPALKDSLDEVISSYWQQRNKK